MCTLGLHPVSIRPYSHPIIFPRGCPFQAGVGAVHWYPSGFRPGRPALPTCVPAWRHSSAADTPPTPTSHPAGGREALCPHFPLLLVPVARRALDPPAHRRPRSPLASGGRPSPDPGRGGRPQGGTPLCPQSRPRIPDGARPSGGAEPAHSPDLFPRSTRRRPCRPSPPRHCGRPAPFLGPAGPPHPGRVGAAPPAARQGGPCFPSPRQTGQEAGPQMPVLYFCAVWIPQGFSVSFPT